MKELHSFNRRFVLRTKSPDFERSMVIEMDKNHVKTNLQEILADIKPLEAIDENQSLFSIHNGFEARDMLITFMRIKESFKIELGPLVKNLEEYSVNNLADRITELVNGQN